LGASNIDPEHRNDRTGNAASAKFEVIDLVISTVVLEEKWVSW